MPNRTAAVITLTLALALGCGGGGDGPGPEATVETFYGHINQGNYTEAMALYSTEAMNTLEELGGGEGSGEASGFAGWARTETREGSLERVSILDVSDSGEETATVEYQVIYEDGTTAQRSVTVVLENGTWKLNLIG